MTLTLPRTAGAFAALMALGLAAGAVRAQDPAQAPAAPAEAPAPVSADTVVATVNGKPITLGEMIALRRELPAETQAIPPQVLFQGLLDQLVTFELMAQATEAQKLTERKDFAMVMANTIRIGKANIHMRHEVNTRVTGEALQALYKERYLDNPVEEVRASHILVDSEEKAAALKAQIDGGAVFADVAKEHGTDGTRSRGGDLGWFVKADMVPEFGDAVFALEKGQISGPVQSPFGWHLIHLADRRQKEAPALDEVRAELEAELTEAAQEAILKSVRDGADIQVDVEALPAEAILQDELIVPIE